MCVHTRQGMPKCSSAPPKQTTNQQKNNSAKLIWTIELTNLVGQGTEGCGALLAEGPYYILCLISLISFSAYFQSSWWYFLALPLGSNWLVRHQMAQFFPRLSEAPHSLVCEEVCPIVTARPKQYSHLLDKASLDACERFCRRKMEREQEERDRCRSDGEAQPCSSQHWSAKFWWQTNILCHVHSIVIWVCIVHMWPSKCTIPKPCGGSLGREHQPFWTAFQISLDHKIMGNCRIRRVVWTSIPHGD